jgi:hypothetical protein
MIWRFHWILTVQQILTQLLSLPQDSEENVKSDNSFSEIEHGRHPSRLNPNYGKVWNWHKAWNLSSNFSLSVRWH